MFPSHLMARDMHSSSLPGSTRNSAAERRVTIRRAAAADAPAVQRLAERDSARPPEGEVVLAEVDGEVVAAMALDGGRAIADPFAPTAEIVRLLELRAAQVRKDQVQCRVSGPYRPEADSRRPRAVAVGR